MRQQFVRTVENTRALKAFAQIVFNPIRSRVP